MSLRANLIIPSEQRSASRINIRSITRLASIVVPAIIIFMAGAQILKYSVTISELRMLESEWALAEPKQNQSRELLAQLHYNMRTSAELEEWKNSRINWNQQLQAILESAPKTIQATSIFISSKLKAPSIPSPPIRSYTLIINGKNSGNKAMDNIKR
jgi:signal recognition particle subunit SEC65